MFNADATPAPPRTVSATRAKQICSINPSTSISILLFHNHPSGDPTPSPDDVALTRRLVAAGALIGIEVVDHVILGDARYCSIKGAKHP
jgi:DNA repair protein RadC